MTLGIRNKWNAISKVLTIINLTLFMVLNGQGFNYKEVRDKKVPLLVNVLLLIFLSLGLFAAIYQLM
ncbi:hypothetical protein ACFSRY_08695 [Pontibacter locisalis]|uniref:Uncharacterized protein n=1 Tax=Pontibacter locisalis TaxID=1719035 RepID=A0ABW5ILT8_9BACT